MVQTAKILGHIDLLHHSAWQPHPLGMGMVTPLLELYHPQAAPFDFAQDRLEDATQN